MPAKKKWNSRRDITDFAHNITGSLFLQQKSSPLEGVSAIVTSAVNTAQRFFTPIVRSSFLGSLISEPPPSRSIDEEDQALACQMIALENECKGRFQQIEEVDKKLANKEISPTRKASLEHAKKALFSEIDGFYLQKVELVPELVREHAARRVDLFFYLMIAVYKQNLFFELDGRKGTNKQHGKGSQARGTAGCHSSLITNVRGATVLNEQAHANTQNILHQILNIFQPGSELPCGAQVNLQITNVERKADNCSGENDLIEQGIDALKKVGEDAVSLLKEATTGEKEADPEDFLAGTYLSDLLNAVTELPEIVNNLDSIIERGNSKITTKASLAILNRVSLGEINPIEGLHQFAKVMHLCFETLQFNYGLVAISKGDSSVTNYPRAFARARQLEREGTFRMFNSQTLAIPYQYIELHLGLRNFSTADLLLSATSYAPLERKMLAMQEEILSNGPAPKRSIKK